MSKEPEIEKTRRFFRTMRRPEYFDFIETLIADDRFSPRKKIEIISDLGEKFEKFLLHAQKEAKNGAISKENIIESAKELGYFKSDFHIEAVEKFITDGIDLLIVKARNKESWNLENPNNDGKPWDTAYTLLALNKTFNSRVHKPDDPNWKSSIEQKIKSGKLWLKNNRYAKGEEVGWRDSPVYDVNVYETSIAVCCLSELGETDSDEVKGAINFLQNHQKRDGGWSGNPNEKESETGATAFAITALLKPEKSSSEKLETGINWLLSNQNDDGGWGERKGKTSIVSKTCDAINALLESGEKLGKNLVRTNAAIQEGVKWLTKNQRTVGAGGFTGWGWRQDCFHFINYLNTAMAVETLLNTSDDIMYLHLLGSSSIQWLLELKENILYTAPGGVIPRVILSLNEYHSRALDALQEVKQST